MTGLLLKLMGWPPFSMLASLFLHAGVVALLLFSLSQDPAPLKTPDTDVIKAVVVDDGKVKAELERIKKAERRKQLKQKKAKKELQRIQQQKKREKKKLAELKRKRLKEKQRLKDDKKAASKKREAIKKAQAKETKRLATLKKKRKEETKRLEKQRKTEAKRLEKQRAKRKLEQEKKRKAEADAKRKAQKAKEEKARRAALRKQMEAEESAERQRDLARKSTTYIAAIRNDVQRNWRRPPGIKTGASCKVYVTQATGGTVLSVRVSSCTGGNTAFSKSVEKAVYKADPLPRAPDPSLFDRELVFDFTVKE
ncbi:MAG TPA: cell envelope integrity protein TolA [Gammaproteobacteria bacterium]|nr:cell envelope integrity protein TolA [Gammaproteobacteria bacterium]